MSGRVFAAIASYGALVTVGAVLIKPASHGIAAVVVWFAIIIYGAAGVGVASASRWPPSRWPS